jgi:hypothetical protein
MVLFHNKNRPRRCLDLRVGESHWLQAVLHLRRIDFQWYKENEDEITAELLELLETSIVPRVFGKEIENYHKRNNPGVIPEDETSTVGSKNKNNNNNNNNSRGKKRGVGAAGAAVSKNDNRYKKKQATAATKGKAGATSNKKGVRTNIDDDEENNKKPEKDVYYSFGELIQLAYQSQEKKSHRTILYKVQETDDDNDNDSRSNFYDHDKLSKDVSIWISQADVDQKTNPDPVGVGFYRPEMLPVSSLFRKPDNESSDEDDE